MGLHLSYPRCELSVYQMADVKQLLEGASAKHAPALADDDSVLGCGCTLCSVFTITVRYGLCYVI